MITEENVQNAYKTGVIVLNQLWEQINDDVTHIRLYVLIYEVTEFLSIEFSDLDKNKISPPDQLMGLPFSYLAI